MSDDYPDVIGRNANSNLPEQPLNLLEIVIQVDRGYKAMGIAAEFGLDSEELDDLLAMFEADYLQGYTITRKK